MAEPKPQDEQVVETQPESAPVVEPTVEPVVEPRVAEATKPEPAKEKEAKAESSKKESTETEKPVTSKDKADTSAAASKEAKDAKPKETKEEAKLKKVRAPLHLTSDALSLGVVVLLFAYLVFAFWHAYQPSTSDANAALVQATSTPTIPQLKLNQPDRRTGPVISVDSGNIGKEDPFKK